MKTIKTDDPAIEQAARSLKSANAMFGEAKKKSEAAKEMITRWLKDNRGVELESMAIGEMVQIEGIILIEVTKQNRFDEAAFSLDHPQLHADYHREKPIKKFKPLVENKATKRGGKKTEARSQEPEEKGRNRVSELVRS